MKKHVLDNISSQLRDGSQLFLEIEHKLRDKIFQAAEILINALKNGNKLLICGNGGSAADAQHFAAEMVGRLQRDRAPLAAIALSTDTSIMTAVANDYTFDDIFKKQVEALGQQGDVLIAISTSGNSKNLVKALEAAKEKKLNTVALSGKDGGAIVKSAEHALILPAMISQRIQEGQIAIIHIWCALIEDALFPE